MSFREAVIRSLFSIICILLFVSGVYAVDLSFSTASSRDELLTALYLGEIDYEQYLLAEEILSGGVDTSQTYLLEELPNLSFVLLKPTELSSNIENM